MMRKLGFKLLFGMLIFSVMTGCDQVNIYSLMEPTETMNFQNQKTLIPTAIDSPTVTVQWFPATATPRPLSTPTAFPTKDMKPDIGEVLLEDVFLNENFWQTFRSDQGNAVISNNELTLAIQFSAGSIASFLDYHPKADYYLSVDVTLPICSDSSDYYGVFFRYGDKDNYDRFLINCQGQTRVEQRYGGKMLPLADWSVNGQIRSSGPQKFTLGMRIKGETLRFFINDVFLYETKDTLLKSGAIGLLANSQGVSPISVSFSNFKIYDLR